jgi:hemoglobin/transferrin/lactoferrin receptor protein
MHVRAQEKNRKDSIQNLETIIVSFNKWEQNRNEVPNKIVGIDMKESRLRNPQTTADLLSSSGAVFVQKSQLGGGSPMIRGFATNRILIVSDGVRMNNAIFRSGNLQNVISIDPLALEEAEVIFGPGSLIYGSDAIGGVMDFHTLEPRFAQGKNMLTKGSATARYSTANNERTVHADVNLGWKKLSVLSSFSYSNFDDQKMGSHGPASYQRPEYVQRINNKDSIIKNTDPAIQRFTGYDQFNLLQKIAYKINDKTELQYGFSYAGTGDVPRYDRLIQYRQGKLRFAEWYYGPMIWRMHQLQLKTEKSNSLFDESRLILAFQDYD